jgi:hypothetical protein
MEAGFGFTAAFSVFYSIHDRKVFTDQSEELSMWFTAFMLFFS